MTMTDLLPLETWVALEKEIHETYGLRAYASNEQGFRVSDWANWANEVCPMIKAVPAATSAICSVANQTFLATMRETHKPMVAECDAGFVKITVPVLHDGELIGMVGGCGLLPEDGEVEEFLVGKATGRSEEEIAQAAASVKRVSQERADAIASWLEGRIADLVVENAA